VLQGDSELLTRIIRDCCQIKADVVAADEQEGGLRAVINFGHTFGHAIEAAGGFSTYTHGEAVAIGMIWATELSRRLGMCSPDLLERVRKLLQTFGLPTALAKSLQGIHEALLLDKKAVGGHVRFILVEALGKVSLRDDVPSQLVEELVTWGLTGHPEAGEEASTHAT
jgi:3-dehydroquinate synthetase